VREIYAPEFHLIAPQAQTRKKKKKGAPEKNGYQGEEVKKTTIGGSKEAFRIAEWKFGEEEEKTHGHGRRRY